MNKTYKASLIISIYKNTEFLKVVLDSLKFQTEQNFEIIISEDAEHAHVRDFIRQYPFIQDYQHITQEDNGWRKNLALNNAIRASKSDWLIFIDGDCVLHPRFIEMHVRYADEKAILAGKRIKLDARLSELLIQDIQNLQIIQKEAFRKLFYAKGKNEFVEEGIFINPDGILGWIPKLRKLNHLLGSNMSFAKSAIEHINGFDEDYVLPAAGEDADLSWRFELAGYIHVSLRNLAIQYHLDHPLNWLEQNENMSMMLSKQASGKFICKNGLIKY